MQNLELNLGDWGSICLYFYETMKGGEKKRWKEKHDVTRQKEEVNY